MALCPRHVKRRVSRRLRVFHVKQLHVLVTKLQGPCHRTLTVRRNSHVHARTHSADPPGACSGRVSRHLLVFHVKHRAPFSGSPAAHPKRAPLKPAASPPAPSPRSAGARGSEGHYCAARTMASYIVPRLSPAAAMAWGTSEVSVNPGRVFASRNQTVPSLSTIRSTRESWRSPSRS